MSRSGKKDSSALKRDVAGLLYGWHLGKARSVNAKRLAEQLNHSEVQIRAAISELVTEGQPIGSTANGFFVITNPGEAVECYRHLESRAKKIFKRLSGLRKGDYVRGPVEDKT